MRRCARITLVMAMCGMGLLVGESRAEFMTFSTTVSVADQTGSGMTVTGNGTDFATIAANANDHVELTGLADPTVTRVQDTDKTFRFGEIQSFNGTHNGHSDYDFVVTYSVTVNDYNHRGGGTGSGLFGSQTLTFSIEYMGRATAGGGAFTLAAFPVSGVLRAALVHRRSHHVLRGCAATIPDPANKTLKKLSFDLRAVPEP